ncbi:MAG: hypothetical protein GXP29_15515 [Planctomycetes bacterium]|nr:hypothetical protein [Planctomycetota bacterium]
MNALTQTPSRSTNRKSNTALATVIALCFFHITANNQTQAADCNSNGIEDATDIAAGTSLDCNNNSMPDECEFETVFSAQQVITTTSFALCVFAADLDGDGNFDVLSASAIDGRIAWYENLLDVGGGGLDGFGLPQVITTGVTGTQTIFAADLDGDGDTDVLLASSNDSKIAWHENTNGLGNFGPQQVIFSAAIGPTSVFAVDIDGDGDADVLSASSGGGRISWYENTDGLGSFGPQQVISNATSGAKSVFAVDLDGDGDADVLSASSVDDEVAWYENTNGLGNFGPQQVITTAADRAQSVFAVDLDGDGDADVLSASATDDKIAWYENTDGMGNFGSQQVITTAADFASSVFAADLDGDGDADVLSASQNDDKIAWYENTDGLGSFGPQQVIIAAANRASSVFAADMDGDGDADVLSASAGDGKIAWYENTRDDCNGNWIPDECDISDGTSTDCNNNSVPDECEPDCNASGLPDDCDVSNQTSEDCNFNNYPDECELDCNASGVPDDCDVANQTSEDCNFNDYPDECELLGNDCNNDGTPDDCQLAELVGSLSGPVDTSACPLSAAQFAVASSLIGLEYSWLKSGVPLIEGVDAIGTDTDTVTIPSASLADEGFYSCEVSLNCISTVTNSATLSIFETLSIAQQPAALSTSCTGNTVVIVVTATGDDLTYEWLQNGLTLQEQPGKYEDVSTPILRIVNADASDLAEYSCVVRDACGGEETTTSAFIQFGDATFVVQPTGQCASEGDTVSYTATADGGAFSVFGQWYKDGIPLSDGGNVSGSFTDTLVIQNVSINDEGSYSQRAFSIGANCVVFSDNIDLELDSCLCGTPGDMEADGDLDLVDLQVFMDCFGANVAELPACACANLDDANDTIDLDDWAAYATLLTGP